MKRRSFFFAVAALAALPFGAVPSAQANDKTTVQIFYDFLSNPGSSKQAEAFKGVVSPDWKSIGDYSGKFKTADVFVSQLAGFAKLIPDMNWKVEEMIESGDRIIVRGHATGTPNGPLFGVDGKGKSFEIMSIDIHTMKDGKITKTYHVEDWAGALRQLQAK